jgi:4-amino-4-deoxy-L-arabinose transferase-like glycosyltransferase
MGRYGVGDTRMARNIASIRVETVWLLLLMASLLLVSLPRFSRNDWGPLGRLTGQDSTVGASNDSDKYITYVHYFRGDAGFGDLVVPFAYRPVVPWLAAWLPFEAMTSINIINFLSLLTTAILLYRLSCSIGFSLRYAILASFMFVVSFPTFYYGTIGMVDPVLILFLTMGLYFSLKRQWAQLLLTVTLGCLVKETMIVLIPVSVTCLILNREPWKLKSALLLVAYLGPLLATRLIFRGLVGTNYLQISFESFLSNLRLRALLSVTLTFGIPGLLSLFFLFRRWVVFDGAYEPAPLSILIPLAEGLLLSVILCLYSMFSAHTDGRFIWTSYPFSIPLALWFLERRKRR